MHDRIFTGPLTRFDFYAAVLRTFTKIRYSSSPVTALAHLQGNTRLGRKVSTMGRGCKGGAGNGSIATPVIAPEVAVIRADAGEITGEPTSRGRAARTRDRRSPSAPAFADPGWRRGPARLDGGQSTRTMSKRGQPVLLLCVNRHKHYLGFGIWTFSGAGES